ncbi:MAG TPA: prolyl oligopeptidase family serine peptidase [Vicinamibacterales bacterium]|nr:prolyl oligopeptidase family serine peptidase [Vicinamibacterales bacterium]
MKKLLLIVCVLSVAAVSAQEVSQPLKSQAAGPKPQTSFQLTVDSIMRGPELVGNPPNNLRWSGDSKELYFEWLMPKEDQPATWVVSRDGGAPRRLSETERRVAPPANGQWDSKRRRILGVDRGDIVIIDTVADTRIDVTRTTGNESNPRWAKDETHVTFVRDNNLFIVPVETVGAGAIVQLTDVSPRRTDPRLTDSQKFIKEEEIKLLDWVEQEAQRRKRREEQDRNRALPKFEIGERQNIADAAVSGDGKYAFLVVNDRAQSRATQVPRYVSESSFTEQINARTFVGDAQDRRRIAVLNLETGDGVWAGLDGVSEPAAIPKPPFGEEPRPASKPEPAPKRDVRWGSPMLSPDGRTATVSVRAADNTERWLVRLDAASGKSTVLDHIKDEAWVRDGGQGWLPDSKRMWFLAEHDGWMHLYTVDATANAPTRKQLTAGRFEIDSVELSADAATFYLRSSETHPGERHVYAMSVDGGARTKITSQVGSHDGAISPDNSMFGLVSSTANRPPEVFLMPNKAGAVATKVTTSPSPEWLAHPWVEPQLVTYKSRDGKDVYARLFTPEMVGARRDPRAPAVVFVHGAGYLQNAHKFWSTYYRAYMFHHLLAARGYVVLDPDYRASAGYGRDWRTAIYRWMGGHDLNDVVDGAAYLVKSHKVNAGRIGVYGGSYGGFITLMALFTSPDTFAAGAALRPVTDWSHYNHGYTSNILNEPQTDAEAYRKSSPIYFAEGLKAPLLIAHGMVDVNVHFQDSVRLAQRLIELRKENWELALYPVEDHGFVEATSWADEYKRILKLFETHLRK